MLAITLRLLLMITVSLSMAACMQTGRETAGAPVVDDDAFCSGKGPPGSNIYAACMKDRDVGREQSRARLDRTHRNVTQDMLNSR